MKIFKIITNWLRLQQIRFHMRPSQLKKAIKQADALHAKDGRRYRVFFFGNKYHVWNRQDIREKQHSGLLKWKKVGEDFDRICFYDTNPGQATSKSLNKEGGARCFF